MSVLNDLRGDVAAASAKAAGNAAASSTSTERKASDFWLNIGLTITGPDNKPLFVSLPVGIALDDMKPQPIKGSNQEWIHLAQTKNALLESLQRMAAGLAPGQRIAVDALNVELFRRNEPQQQGNTEDNPLLASMLAALMPKAA